MTQDPENLSQQDSIPTNPWHLFLSVMLSQFFLYGLIQLESYFLYVHLSGDGWGAGFIFLMKWPFLQLESLLFALLLGGLAFLFYSRVLLR